MSPRFKMGIFILLAIVFILINTYYNGIVIRAYNWITGLPKMLLVFITLTIIFAPFLLKNNKAIDLCKDFLPDSISKRIDLINATKVLPVYTPYIQKTIPSNLLLLYLVKTDYLKMIRKRAIQSSSSNMGDKFKCHSVLL